MDDEDDVQFKEGTVIETGKANYTVLKLLGEGGYGAVYLVQSDQGAKKKFAMKVEKKLENREHAKLTMEVAILKLASSVKTLSHFTALEDRGKKDNFYFIVMQLVGKSLADLKEKRPDRVFSPCTALGVSIQCLEACEGLHKHGFIHRDLKPANYACGLDNLKRLIYMFDFGIARKITNTKNELKTPRASTRFKGTIPFAAIACHKGIELGPKDDVESWFYLLLSILVPSGLPWRHGSDKNEVLRQKEECRREKRVLLWGGVKCREELSKLLDYIDKLLYHDHVDYGYIYKMIEEAAVVCGGSVNDPYDWEREKA